MHKLICSITVARQLSVSEAELQETLSNNEDMRALLEEYTPTLDKVASEISKFQQALKDNPELSGTSQNEIDALKKKFEEKEKLLSKAKKTADNAKRKAEKEADIKKKELSEISRMVKSLQTQMVDMREENNLLRQRCETAAETNKELDTRVKALEAQHQAADRHVTSLDTELRFSRNQVAKVSEKVADLAHQLDAVKRAQAGVRPSSLLFF